jgi:hypothetical protein
VAKVAKVAKVAFRCKGEEQTGSLADRDSRQTIVSGAPIVKPL